MFSLRLMSSLGPRLESVKSMQPFSRCPKHWKSRPSKHASSIAGPAACPSAPAAFVSLSSPGDLKYSLTSFSKDFSHPGSKLPQNQSRDPHEMEYGIPLSVSHWSPVLRLKPGKLPLMPGPLSGVPLCGSSGFMRTPRKDS